jgi:transcriptional regulator with XRE-family HTH domain
VEQYRCQRCGRELFDFGDGPPPTRCEDCVPETGQGSRLVDQLTTNLRELRRKAGIEREELARRAGMSADEIALAEREAAREPGVTRALRLAHSIGVSIDDLADRIYWNPGEIARSPGDRRPSSERLSGFFLVLPANVPIFDPAPPRDPVTSRKELAEVFGENLRSARERRHLFQKTLAEAAGLSRDGLSYIERGIHETTIETMLSIARALQVPPEILLPEAPDFNPGGEETDLEEEVPATGDDEEEVGAVEVEPEVDTEAPPPGGVTSAGTEAPPPQPIAVPEPTTPAPKPEPVQQTATEPPTPAPIANQSITAPKQRPNRHSVSARASEEAMPPTEPAQQEAPWSQPVAATPPDSGRNLAGKDSYVVQPGDCLWHIAADLLPGSASTDAVAHEVERLWRLNEDRIGTGDPNLIYAGTELRLR